MSPLNIVLFGETGVGKSSVINMAAGAPVARVSSDVQNCTPTCCQYTVSIDSKTFHLWDTVGLVESELNSTRYLDAVVAVSALIQKLEQQGVVDLLLFCMRGSRITETTLSNYRLFYEVLCRFRIPISLVITHLEQEPDLNSWWTRNVSTLKKYGIRSAGHACITGLPNDTKYDQSKNNINRLLCGYDGRGKYVMPAEPWFKRFFRWFVSSKDLNGRGLLRVLTKRCKLNVKIAEELAMMLERQL